MSPFLFLPLLALGGALGTLLRFGMLGSLQPLLGKDGYYATILVNLTGSLLIGLIFGLVESRYPLSREWRDILCVGVLGGFTTFSAFSLENIYLLSQGERFRCFLNISLSVFVCLLACMAGMRIGLRYQA